MLLGSEGTQESVENKKEPEFFQILSLPKALPEFSDGLIQISPEVEVGGPGFSCIWLPQSRTI